MKSMHIESIFHQESNWKSCQIFVKYNNKQITEKIYDKKCITCDACTLYIQTDTGLIVVDIDSIYAIQLFVESVDELVEKLFTEADDEENSG